MTEAGVSAEDVLRKAAELIRREGWWDGTPGASVDGSQCLATALHAVTTHDVTLPVPERTARYGAGRRLLLRRLGTPNIVTWNDAPGRTVEEVLAVLEGEPA